MSNYQLCDTYIDTILVIFGNNIWIGKNVRSRSVNLRKMGKTRRL